MPALNSVVLAQRQAHGHAHEEDLRQLETHVVGVQEVAVVQRLQAEVGELQVAVGVQCCSQALEIELRQIRAQQLQLDAAADIGLQGFGVQRLHVTVGGPEAVLGVAYAEKRQCLCAQRIEQQTRADLAVVGLFLDQRARGHQQGSADVGDTDAVVQVLERLAQDALGIHFREPRTGFLQHHLDALQRQRAGAAVFQRDANIRHLGHLRQFRLGALGADAGTLFAVQDVVARDALLAAAHQRQLHLVLDIFDVDGAAGGHAALERAGDLCQQLVDHLADTRTGGCGAAFDRQKCLGHGHGDLGGIEGHDLAVALDDADLSGGCGRYRCRQRILLVRGAGVRLPCGALVMGGVLGRVVVVCSLMDAWL